MSAAKKKQPTGEWTVREFDNDERPIGGLYVGDRVWEPGATVATKDLPKDVDIEALVAQGVLARTEGGE